MIEIVKEVFIKTGEKWKIDFSKGNLNNKTIHIRAIVDEEYIVYKHWLKRKKRWDYAIERYYFFKLIYEQGCFKKLK